MNIYKYNRMLYDTTVQFNFEKKPAKPNFLRVSGKNKTKKKFSKKIFLRGGALIFGAKNFEKARETHFSTRFG